MIGTAPYTLAGINIVRATDALVLYTPTWGTNTKTNKYGAEATIVDGKITKFVDRSRTGASATTIPKNGVVLSGHGKARDWLVANAKVGRAYVGPPIVTAP